MAIGTNLVKNQPSFRSGMIRAFDLFGAYDREEFDLSALDPATAWKYDWEALNNDFHKVNGGQPTRPTTGNRSRPKRRRGIDFAVTELPGAQDNQPNPSDDTAQNSGEISITDDTHQSQSLARKVEEGTGPLPTPNDLREFDDIVPGFAKKLTGFYFAQAEHRMDIERKITESSTKATARGQWAAFAISIITVLAGLGVATVIVSAGSGGWAARIGWASGIVIAQIVVIAGALIRNLRNGGNSNARRRNGARMRPADSQG